MNESVLLAFFLEYGYWIMFLIMTIEGPGATMIAAGLSSAGHFNVFIVLMLSILGDILGDILLYGAGRKWGMKFVNGYGRYLGLTENLVTKMKRHFEIHGGKTIFAVKSTTGLCWAAFVAAGIAGMPFWKFVKFSFLGGVVWSAFLVAMGYFFGYLWQEIEQYIKYTGWVIGGLAIAFFVGINLYKKKEGQEMIQDMK